MIELLDAENMIGEQRHATLPPLDGDAVDVTRRVVAVGPGTRERQRLDADRAVGVDLDAGAEERQAQPLAVDDAVQAQIRPRPMWPAHHDPVDEDLAHRGAPTGAGC